jgi:GNAT superfamily N-acetyltransferase
MQSNYNISTDKSLLDVAAVHHFLSTEAYWSKHIPIATVQRAIENSLCFGIYHGTAQVGFARLITDYATFAYLSDVYVLQEHRGKGLSKRLMETIMAHPDVQGLRRWVLLTHDAHGLYAQHGWSPITYVERWMQVHRPDIYTAGGG